MCTRPSTSSAWWPSSAWSRGSPAASGGPNRSRSPSSGIGISFVPDVLEIQLTPDLVLIGLLPPLLYAAAIRTSLVDFRANKRPILLLSVGWSCSRPSPSAPVVVGRPRRDAGRRLRARCGRRAAGRCRRDHGRPARRHAPLDRVDPRGREPGQRRHRAGRPEHRHRRADRVDQPVARRLGLRPRRRRRHRSSACVAAFVLAMVRKRIQDPVLDTTLSFAAPYVAFLPAQQIHSSGVLAVVVTGLLLGHKAPVLQTASSRIAENINWRTVQFLLENVVFLLIGLQIRRLVSSVRADHLPWTQVVWPCLAVLGCHRPGPGPLDVRRHQHAAAARPVPTWDWRTSTRRLLGRHARRRHAGRGLPAARRHPRSARCSRSPRSPSSPERC